jgi:hypothetical protein
MQEPFGIDGEEEESSSSPDDESSDGSSFFFFFFSTFCFLSLLSLFILSSFLSLSLGAGTVGEVGLPLASSDFTYKS